MRKHYDFSQAKPNPYAKRLRKQVTMRVDKETVDYFKRMAEETGLPYQKLIDLYLLDCARKRKKLTMKWVA